MHVAIFQRATKHLKKKWKVGKFVKFAKWTPLTYLHGLGGIVLGLGEIVLGLGGIVLASNL